jgi:acetyl-CoA carboxylase carboxyl transferase subunit alpha
MLEHSYYSVISPEGCASILWKDASKRNIAAEALKLNAEDLLKANVIEGIIKEPLGGAHHDRKMTYDAVRTFILDEYQGLKILSTDLLLERRYGKFRRIGAE